MFRYLPEQASENAPNIDWLHNLITDVSVFFTVAIVGAMIYFAIKYRRRDGVDHETPQLKGSHLLEVVWTVVPTVICIYIAYYGVVFFNDIRRSPKDAIEINVWAQKWRWDFQYTNGKKTTGEFVIPVNKPVKLILQSRDVLHSFYLPSMRVKSDAVPGTFTYVAFKPVKAGIYNTFCTEYCGDNHSNMMAKLSVVSEAEYQRWVNDRSEELAAKNMNPADLGRKLYTEKGCIACHNLTGTRLIGPSFLKIYGREGKWSDGQAYKADENYIQESIQYPNKHIVEGFTPNVMPSFDGQLTPDEISGIIAFMKTLDGSQTAAQAAPAADTKSLAAMTPAERGKKLYTEKTCMACHSLDGTKIVGPSFKGIYGRKGKLSDGKDYVADDSYITESIKQPSAKIVEGFPSPSPMPPMPVSDDEIKDIIEFMKTLK